MALSSGDKVRAYEIVAPLGAGGIGEVYRARDLKLGRDVAMKLFPASLAGDADWLARVQRESQVLAPLPHPNIAAIYALEGNAIVNDGLRAVKEWCEVGIVRRGFEKGRRETCQTDAGGLTNSPERVRARTLSGPLFQFSRILLDLIFRRGVMRFGRSVALTVPARCQNVGCLALWWESSASAGTWPSAMTVIMASSGTGNGCASKPFRAASAELFATTE